MKNLYPPPPEITVEEQKLISKIKDGERDYSWLERLIYKWIDYHRESKYNFTYYLRIDDIGKYIRIGYMVVDQCGNCWAVLDRSDHLIKVVTLSAVPDQNFIFEKLIPFSQAYQEAKCDPY